MTILQSADIKELATALALAQARIEGAEKSGTNPHFHTKYATLASVWDAARKPLTDNGLSVVQLPGEYNVAGGTMALTTRLMHSSGQWLELCMTIPVPKADPQGYGSALTYARRYALGALASVCPEDDDGNRASGAPDGRSPQPAARSVAPAARATAAPVRAGMNGPAWEISDGVPVCLAHDAPLAHRTGTKKPPAVGTYDFFACPKKSPAGIWCSTKADASEVAEACLPDAEQSDPPPAEGDDPHANAIADFQILVDEAASLQELKQVAAMLKKAPKPVADALRPRYAARQAELNQ